MTTRAWWLILFPMCLLAACGSSGTYYDDSDSDSDACSDGDRVCIDLMEVEVCSSGAWSAAITCADEQQCEDGQCVASWDESETESTENEGSGSDYLPPSLVSTSPTEDSLTVSAAVGTLVFTFSEPLDTSRFTCASDLQVESSCTTPTTTCTFSEKSTVLKVGLSLLDAGTSYTFTLEPGSLYDLAGNVFPGYSLRFQTAGTAPDSSVCSSR